MEQSYRRLSTEIINRYFAPFKQKTRPCVWLSAFAPAELVACFPVDIIYPESYAAVLAPKKIGLELLAKATALGLNESVCSYMRIFEAAQAWSGPLPMGSIPRPDAMVVTNNQCSTLFMMWKILSERYRVPLFVLDLPVAQNPQRSDYVGSQIRELTSFLENTFAQPLSEETLNDQIERSNRVSELWARLCHEVFTDEMDLSLNALINNFFFQVVCCRTHEWTAPVLNAVLLERRRVEPRKGHEKRIYWFGYPFWFSKEKFPDLSASGGRIVANNYLQWWDIPIPRAGDPLAALGAAYADSYLNQTLAEKMRRLMNDLARYRIDGVIVHSNASCKRDSVVSQKVVAELSAAHVPTVEFQADMCDGDKYQERHSMLRAETLMEALR